MTAILILVGIILYLLIGALCATAWIHGSNFETWSKGVRSDFWTGNWEIWKRHVIKTAVCWALAWPLLWVLQLFLAIGRGIRWGFKKSFIDPIASGAEWMFNRVHEEKEE